MHAFCNATSRLRCRHVLAALPNSMIIYPYDEDLSEIKSFENDITISKITKNKIKLSGGWRYKNTLRPKLYKDIIGTNHESNTTPVWMKKNYN